MPSPTVGQYPKIPRVGQKPPHIHTLIVADVGDDRHPGPARPDAQGRLRRSRRQATGRLAFATPALCQSRVCGPVVDITQQVADGYEGKADFIHQEVYVENEPSKGIRPQLRAFGLPTEPWTFLVDRNGVIRDRIEGAYGVSELEEDDRPGLIGQGCAGLVVLR